MWLEHKEMNERFNESQSHIYAAFGQDLNLRIFTKCTPEIFILLTSFLIESYSKNHNLPLTLLKEALNEMIDKKLLDECTPKTKDQIEVEESSINNKNYTGLCYAEFIREISKAVIHKSFERNVSVKLVLSDIKSFVKHLLEMENY